MTTRRAALAETAEVPARVHLVGVCGAGMSGLARVLVQRGHAVSGSDLREGRTAAELRALGVEVAVGHAPANVGDAGLVVTSAAVPQTNPELVEARARGIPVIARAELLALLMLHRRAVLVAGTHGKTTTTSMLVVALQAAGGDPGFAIGGSLSERGTNAHAGTDDVFVAEADESDRSLLVHSPDVAIVTNVELDHPDEYVDEADVHRTFVRFLDRRRPGAPGIVCLDDPGVRGLLDVARSPLVTYGTDPAADVRLLRGPDGPTVRVDGDALPLRLSVPGRHNELNATGVAAALHVLGADVARGLTGVAAFTGAVRRFHRLGEVDGVAVVDDYAHHPTEVRATLEAARSVGPTRLVVVVQPHRFSRTALLGAELGRAAAGADVVVVTDVYGAGEAPIPGVTGRSVADAAVAAGADVRYAPHLPDVVEELVRTVRPGDLVLVTGAGDVTTVGPTLLDRLAGR